MSPDYDVVPHILSDAHVALFDNLTDTSCDIFGDDAESESSKGTLDSTANSSQRKKRSSKSTLLPQIPQLASSGQSSTGSTTRR